MFKMVKFLLYSLIGNLYFTFLKKNMKKIVYKYFIFWKVDFRLKFTISLRNAIYEQLF